jgi:hypothetical protein
LMIGKFEELLNLECESRKNCLLKSDWNTKLKYFRYNYRKDEPKIYRLL